LYTSFIWYRQYRNDLYRLYRGFQHDITQPAGMLVEAILRYTTAGDNRPCELGVQAARAICDGHHVTVIQRRTREEIEYKSIDRPAFAFHQVVHQAVPSWLVQMQEPTGDIEAQSREYLAALPLQERIGVIQYGVEGVDRMPGIASWREWR
jgi:hypothetical protein